jgi:hypothetical protein
MDANLNNLNSDKLEHVVQSIASSSLPQPADGVTQMNITALAVDCTFMAPLGTPKTSQKMVWRIRDNGTSRALAYNAVYRGLFATLPVQTVAGKTTYLAWIWSAIDSKWDLVSVVTEV